MNNKRIILTGEVAAEKLHRIALEVAEQLSEDDADLIIIGIHGKGNLIANKITAHLKKYISSPIESITLFIDKHKPAEITLSKDIDFNDKNILLIDDVSNSGKTLMYALKPLMQFYPKRIQTLVLVERMHKLFPVKPDYVGYSVATLSNDYIHVEEENENINAVLISGD